jgi:hypothetical protein
MTMWIWKSAVAALLAGVSAVAISVTALAAAAGPVTIMLTCDTGPAGSGTFTVTADGRFTTVTVPCDRSATVSNPAWTAGSIAVIHQTAWPAGAVRAADMRITLRTTAQTVAIRNFRATTILPQTGGGIPAVPLAFGLAGLLLVGIGARTLRISKRA